MTESCPISPDSIDDRATRIGAGLVILLTLASLGLGRVWLPLLLTVDFGLRSRDWSAWSPVAQMAKGLRSLAGLQPQPINAGPKRFAALVGVLFSLGIALALFFHHPRPALALGAVLILCAALEAFLGFCVGCKVYSLLQAAWGPHSLPKDTDEYLTPTTERPAFRAIPDSLEHP